MFRAQIRWISNRPVLKMEGRIVGSWAEQAEVLVTEEGFMRGLMVDLTEVSYVDSRGEQLLRWLAILGSEFVAGNVYAAGVCDRLCLPIRLAPRMKRCDAAMQRQAGDTDPAS
ncbi:MAG TPA: hypothetical protein VMU05_21145 [Dongiaceae bacterium]|nr:hypothetical protein [Dongiaceae bacterium]